MADNLIPPKSLAKKKYPVPDAKNIYFSFWSWSLLKDCPHSFYLNVIEQVERPKSLDKGNAIQGSIPHSQSEDFFRLPIPQRDMNFFLETFEDYWKKFIKENHVDWMQHGARFLKYMSRETKSTVQFWGRKHGIIVPEKGFPWKELKREQIIAQFQHKQDALGELGYVTKKAETLEHSKNLMRLVASLELHKRAARTELPFKSIIEPGRSDATGFTPELAIGGRIDLVIDLDENTCEVWDVKGVQDPKNLDIDQLIIYKMGVQAGGKIVRRVGYLDVKNCDAIVKKVLDSHEYQLRKTMRFAATHFKHNQWPANYREWKCKMCDVRSHCQTFQSRLSRSQELADLTPGKVDW